MHFRNSSLQLSTCKRPTYTTTMSDSLKGKVIAITGGSSGIGLATARLISSRGATVCIADLKPDETLTFPTPFSITKVDVSKRAEVDAWIGGIVKQFGRLDGAANAAGVIGRNHSVGSLADLEDDEWERIISVNLTGCMHSLRAELKVIEDGGSIVNVASIHGTNGTSCDDIKESRLIHAALPYHAAYGASKHGVVGLTRAAAKENGGREVRVNAVAPGAINTPMMHLALNQLGKPSDAEVDTPSAIKRMGTAEEVAGVIAFLLGPDSTFVSGSVYAVDGGWL